MAPDATAEAYFDHSSAKRVATDTVIGKALHAQYPSLELLIVPEASCGLISYARSGHAVLTPIDKAEDKNLPGSLAWEVYIPPARRINGGRGSLGERLIFAKFIYHWQGVEFLLYLADGRDGVSSYPEYRNYYILMSPTDRPKAEALVLAAGYWSQELHEEVWVFDGGYWQKSAELYDSIRSASWENVILDAAVKKAIIADHMSFFESQETYTKLKVPWKRGVIYYGPPGNGKTISIKAMMHTLYGLKEPIPTLYVRTLASFGGPEYAVRQIFAKARQFAPCYLVFEDLDTIVNDQVRSYFLNEVDGLKSNDGIFMVGSTNHLDRLDPGISKRPSRFDRKYLFPDPNRDQRVAYCQFWQRKLSDNKDIEFPDELCGAIADITDKFSFAYMQEAFVAALLAIARKSEGGDEEDDSIEMIEDDWVGVVRSSTGCMPSRGGSNMSREGEQHGHGHGHDHGYGGHDDDNENENENDDDDKDDLDKLLLWVEIKKQIKVLREGMEDKGSETVIISRLTEATAALCL